MSKERFVVRVSQIAYLLLVSLETLCDCEYHDIVKEQEKSKYMQAYGLTIYTVVTPT